MGVKGAGMRERGRVLGVRAAGCVLLGSLLLPVMGCGSFFQCQNKAACPATGSSSGTGTSSSSVDFAFVSYTNSSGTSVITGYNLGAGALSAINSVNLSFVPIAMAVNPKNSLLYVASVPGATSPGIYAYAIGTDGTLSATNGGAALVNDLVGAMTISPDGNHLYTVESVNQTITQWTLSSTGSLSDTGSLLVQALSCNLLATTPVLPGCSVAVSPKEDYLMASLGTYGDAVFTYSTSGGVPNQTPFTTINALNTSSGDFAVALDASDNAYVAQTSTLTTYTLSSSGYTQRGTTYSYPTGSVPRSVVVDTTSKFVYTADVGTSKISGFATGSAGVTSLTGSPFAAPASVAALGIDSSDSYLVAVGYDATAGVQLYSIASTGVISALAKTAGTSTATQYPVLLAMSH